jgi:hypothetical protein
MIPMLSSVKSPPGPVAAESSKIEPCTLPFPSSQSALETSDSPASIGSPSEGIGDEVSEGTARELYNKEEIRELEAERHSGKLPETDSLQPEHDAGDSRYSQTSYEDDAIRAGLSLSFPLSASRIVTRKLDELERHVLPLQGNYNFEAGYDIVPDQCALRFPEQESYFQGNSMPF